MRIFYNEHKKIAILVLVFIMIFFMVLIGYFNKTRSNNEVLAKGEIILLESYEDQVDSFSVFDLELLKLDSAFFDLDIGETGNTEGSDIYVGMTTGSDTFPFIEPKNDATILLFGDKKPQKDDCVLDLENFNNHAVPTFVENYYCVITNQGNISILYISEPNQFETNGYYTLKVMVHIWYQTFSESVS